MEIGSKEWEQLIIDGAERFDIHINRTQTRQFAVYAAELMKWNRKINLTAIEDPKGVAVKHFLDSIIPSRHISPSAKILDIGSGGGFPGIPLKILMPGLSVTLIDSSRKKVSFLKHVIRTLKLENIEVHQLRAEEFVKQPSACNSFDVIISRAMSSLQAFIKMAIPLLARNGVIIAMKSATPLKEIEAVASGGKNNVFDLKINDVNYFLKLEKYMLPYRKLYRSLLILNSGGCYEHQ